MYYKKMKKIPKKLLHYYLYNGIINSTRNRIKGKGGMDMSKIIINTGNTVGTTRNLDELGRIVIPAEYRKKLQIKEKDTVEIYLLKDGVYIKKINKEENL